MKRAIKILSIMVMTVILLTITVAPALATGFNFEDAISEFYSDGTNTFELAIEKTHKPGAALWTEGGMATCYSSNESVVTVSEKGLVTAIGEGTAYVAIDAGSMYKLYCYTVFDPAAPDYNTVGSTGNTTGETTDSFEEFKNAIEQQREETQKKAEETQQKIEETRKEIEEATEYQNKIEDVQRNIFSKAFGFIGGMGTFIILITIILLGLLIAEITYIFITAPKCGMSRWWAIVPVFSNVLGLIVFIIVCSNRKTTVSSRTIVCPTCNSVHPLGTTECSICGTKLQ